MKARENLQTTTKSRREIWKYILQKKLCIIYLFVVSWLVANNNSSLFYLQ
jgi:hypothetical protein